MGQAYDYWQDQPGILQDIYSKVNAHFEVVFTWDTHKAFQLSALYCPSFKLTSLKWDQKQVSRPIWTVPGTWQEHTSEFIASLLACKDLQYQRYFSFAQSVLVHLSRLVWSQRLHFQLLVLQCSITWNLTRQRLTTS